MPVVLFLKKYQGRKLIYTCVYVCVCVYGVGNVKFSYQGICITLTVFLSHVENYTSHVVHFISQWLTLQTVAASELHLFCALTTPSASFTSHGHLWYVYCTPYPNDKFLDLTREAV